MYINILHKIPNLESPKKGHSRFVGSFSFWTFLKNRKMSILQKRLLKFGKKRANTIMQRILFFIKKFDCILFFTKNI